MKISVKQLKQLIKEQVQEVIEGRQDAGMFRVEELLDAPEVQDAINTLKPFVTNPLLKDKVIKALGL